MTRAGGHTELVVSLGRLAVRPRAYPDVGRPAPFDPAWVLRLVGVTLLCIGLVATASHTADTGVYPLLALIGLTAAIGFIDRRMSWRWLRAALAGLAVLGLIYQLAYPGGFGWVFALITTVRAVTRLPRRAGFTLAGAVLVVYSAVVGPQAGSVYSAMELAGGVVGVAALANSIRQARENSETLARLLAEEQRSAAAKASAEALAERARLARDLHDVLGHTLSAQILRLEGAIVLLRRGAEADVVLAWVEQAQKLARDGLAESKDALASLRGTAAPAVEAVRALAAESGARFSVSGTPRRLTPEVGLAVRRVAQEALTNVRRYAPDATVDVSLGYPEGACTLEVIDTGSSGPQPLFAGAGSGSGLTGMRERAELLGGTLEAGPIGSGFRVWLSIPA